MTHDAEEILLRLQREQQHHDDVAHRDILSFDLYKRLKHMVLHFFKYAGKIEAARDAGDDESLRRTLIDVFIICMASANALNVSLGASIKVRAESDELDALAHVLAKNILATDLFSESVRQLVLIGGKMAKAVESSDHMERGDPRSDMERLVPQLAESILGLLGKMRGGIGYEIRERLASIERKSVLRREPLSAGSQQ